MALAGSITELHVKMAAVPAHWVHVVFEEYGVGHAFTAGAPNAIVSLMLVIRTGRSSDYKRLLMAELWRLVQAATNASDEQIVLGVQEVPASQAMEMGVAMPDVEPT
jgi:phenylpyruvate tautomerase PptA (4-oxalocrotonate tautomerase family)